MVMIRSEYYSIKETSMKTRVTTYTYDIPMVYTPQRCHISFIIPNKVQYTIKGGNVTNTRYVGYKLVVYLVDIVSLVGHTSNSVGVRWYFGLACVNQLTHAVAVFLFNSLTTAVEAYSLSLRSE